MGRISDALGRLRDYWTLSGSVRRLERDARDVLTEATLTLERLNTLAARLAKRDARYYRAAAEAPVSDERPVSRVVGGSTTARAPARAHKAEVRARIFGARLPSEPPPCETCDDDPPPGV